MRRARIYYREVLAGILTETDDGQFIFKYDKAYISDSPGRHITFTMPVREKPYTDKQLFAFFEGLIPEGWLLDIAARNWKINRYDRMGLLLACCRDCIGAVSVEPIREEDEE